ELQKEKHLLISEHTRKYLREEHIFPGPVINRANRARWKEMGEFTLEERAHMEVEELVKSYMPSTLAEDTKREIINLMEREGKKYGQASLPDRY
nr:trimethylamine methyltransferase family protein [Candidatus Neomarinimicrobiota bacterium]